MAALCYNYCPTNCTTSGTDYVVWGPYGDDAWGSSWGNNCYSSTNIPYSPPDEAESEEVQVCPWLFLLPEDQRDPVVRPPTARPPRRPARCRDPPG